MKTDIYPRRHKVGALFGFAALLGLLAVGCGNKASESTNAAPTAAASSAVPAAPTADGRPAPGNPNPNAAANAAAFEAARKKAEGK